MVVVGLIAWFVLLFTYPGFGIESPKVEAFIPKVHSILPAVEKDGIDQARWKEIEARLRRLRIAEMRGAFFQGLATEAMREKFKDPAELNFFLSRLRAGVVYEAAKEANEEDRKIALEAYNEFENQIRDYFKS